MFANQNTITVLLLLTLTLACSNRVAQAEEWLDTKELITHNDSCPRLTGAGEIVYSVGDNLRKQPTRIEFTQWDTVTVVINSVHQKADRIRTRDLGNGRKLVTLLFKRPEVLGGHGAALLSGTVYHKGKDAMFYGNVYFNSKEPYHEICESNSWFSNDTFAWDYIGKFEYRNF